MPHYGLHFVKPIQSIDGGFAAKRKKSNGDIPLLSLLLRLGIPEPVGAVLALPASFPRSAGAAVFDVAVQELHLPLPHTECMASRCDPDRLDSSGVLLLNYLPHLDYNTSYMHIHTTIKERVVHQNDVWLLLKGSADLSALSRKSVH
ncbi:hypothetical protein A3842_11155 [Paenibacillus sp. P3E]|nr:hypothetical protein A3842_11155 [Paenibacillus sp. P3E]